MDKNQNNLKNKLLNQKIDKLESELKSVKNRLRAINGVAQRTLLENSRSFSEYVKENIKTIEMFSDLTIDVKIGEKE
jgi:hypothetical protein